MTWYPDLSEYTYLPDSAPEGKTILAVGWLDGEHDFPTGDVPQEFIDNVAEQAATYGYAKMRGWHGCEIPHPNEVDYPITAVIDGKEVTLGDAEIRVTTENGTILTAPNLIYHYITVHHYRPPEEFIQAVLQRRMLPPEGPPISERQGHVWDKFREGLRAIDETRRNETETP